jgi:hypothetical protein
MLNPETHEPTSNLVLKTSKAQSRSSRTDVESGQAAWRIERRHALSPLPSSGAVTDRFAALEECDHCRPENTGVYSFGFSFIQSSDFPVHPWGIYVSLPHPNPPNAISTSDGKLLSFRKPRLLQFTLLRPKSSSLLVSCGILSQRLLCRFRRPGDYLLLWPSSSLIHFLFANFTSLRSQS